MEVDHQRVRCAVRAWSSTLALVSCLACSRDKVGQERAPSTEQASDASPLQSRVELPESASGRSPKRQGPTPRPDPRVIALAERTGSADPKLAAALRDCVTRHSRPQEPVQGEELRNLVRQIKASCLLLAEDERAPHTLEAKRRLDMSRYAMPLVIATYPPARAPLELRYFCGDVCPDYGYVVFAMADVAPEDCCAMGSTPVFDGAHNNYVGCEPPELSDPKAHQEACDGVARRTNAPAPADAF